MIISKRSKMSTTLLSLILWLSFGSLLGESSGTVRSQSRFSQQLNAQSELADFCELLDHPAQYRGRPIRLKAVLVENNNKMLIDGADPTLYDIACRNKKRVVVVKWTKKAYEGSTASESLRE